MSICVFTSYYCKLVTGGGTYGTVLYTVRGVRGLGNRMLTIDTKKSLYSEDRGPQVPMALEHDKILGSQFCDTPSHPS
jgi:hypothetical protein